MLSKLITALMSFYIFFLPKTAESSSKLGRPEKIDPKSLQEGREISDFSARLILLIAFLFIILGITLHFALLSFFHTLKQKKGPNLGLAKTFIHIPTDPKLPHLQTNPQQDLRNYLKEENKNLRGFNLSSFGSLGKSGPPSYVQVPIDRAIEELSHENKPVF